MVSVAVAVAVAAPNDGNAACNSSNSSNSSSNSSGTACLSEVVNRRDGNLGPFLRQLCDETLMNLLEYLDEESLLRLGCCSPVLYVLCNEEPLWRQICHLKHGFGFRFLGTWKETARSTKVSTAPIPVAGFSSDFLYRRWFRGHVDLSAFIPEDDGTYIERRPIDLIALDEFQKSYERPRRLLMLTGLEKLKGWI